MGSLLAQIQAQEREEQEARSRTKEGIHALPSGTAAEQGGMGSKEKEEEIKERDNSS